MNTPQTISGGHVEIQNGSPLKSKVMTTHSRDSHAECTEITYHNDSIVKSSDTETYCQSLDKPQEVQILSIVHPKHGNKFHEEFEIIVRCECLADCVEVIPSSHFCVESDNVTSNSFSSAKPETVAPANILHVSSENNQSSYNNVESEDMKDSVFYTDSDMVIPDLESKIENGVRPYKKNSRGVGLYDNT